MAYHWIIIIIISRCIVFSVTEINLAGIVVNKNSSPLQGVIVTLIGKQLSDTTGSDGKFVISAKPSTIRSQIPVSSRQPSMLSTVSLFNSRGQLIGNFTHFPNNKILQKSIFPEKHSCGVYLLQYNGPIQSPIAKCLLEQSVSRPFSLPENIRPKSLLKQSVIDDTLHFTKKRYISKWLKMTSSVDTEGTIELDTSLASFAIRKPMSVNKVMQYDTSTFSTEKVWDADFICDCQKTDLNASIYIQVSPIADDTLYLPQYSPQHFRVVSAWIIKDGILQTLDTVGYNPGDHHAGPDFWFSFKGTRYGAYYSSLAYNGRPCGNLDCMWTANGKDRGARKVCADKCPFPISCVRVNTDGTAPPFVYDPYETGKLPCVGDYLCQ